MIPQEIQRYQSQGSSDQRQDRKQSTQEVLIVLPKSRLMAGDDLLAKSFFSLAKGLSSSESKVSFLIFDHGEQSKEQIGEFLAQCSLSGIELQYLIPDRFPHLVGPATACTSYLLYLWLMENDKYDVVHVPDWQGLGFFAQLAKHQGLSFQNVHFVIDVYGPSFWRATVDQRFTASPLSLATNFIERESVRLADSIFAPLPLLLKVMESEGWTLPNRQYWLQLTQREKLGHIAESQSTTSGVQKLTEIIYFGQLDQRDGLASFCDAIDAHADSLRECQVTFRGETPHSSEAQLRTYLEKRSENWKSPWQFIPTDDLSRFDSLKGDGKLVIIGGTTRSSLVLAINCSLVGMPLLYNSYAARTNAQLIPISPAAYFDSDKTLQEKIRQAIQNGVVSGEEADISNDHKQWWKNAHATMFRTCDVREDVSSEQPLISICLAHYNRPKLLHLALQSLDRQTYSNIEVVVGDDGSDGPGVQQELDKLQEKYQHRGWKILRLPHRNVGATRTSAATEAKGEYLLFMDDDNIARPDELATLVEVSLRTAADIVTSAFDAFEDKNDEPGDKPFYRKIFLGNAVECGLTENVFGDANALIKRSLFFKLHGFDDEPAVAWQDWDFFVRAVLSGAHLEAVPEPLYFYRTSGTSMNKTSSEWRSAQSVIGQYKKALPRQFGAIPELLFGLSRISPQLAPSAVIETSERANDSDEPHPPIKSVRTEPISTIQPLLEETENENRNEIDLPKPPLSEALVKLGSEPQSLTARLRNNRVAKIAWWVCTGKLPGKIIERQRRLNQISASPLFDKEWYRDKYGAQDPVKHYLAVGGAQGLDPGPNFNSRWYRERYPDSQSLLVTPLEHFIEVGIPLHRTARPEDEPDFAEFDEQWYRRTNADLSQSTIMPFAHYMLFGKAEGRSPNLKSEPDFPIFDFQWYRQEYGDLGESDIQLFIDYCTEGKRTGKFPNADLKLRSLFNADWYKTSYLDSIESEIDPLEHFLKYGRERGFAPYAEADPEAKDFDEEWYRYRYPDINDLELPPLWHYLLYGRREGRLKKPVDGPSSVASAIANRFPLQQPMHMFAQRTATKRLTVFIDDIEENKYAGRSGTAIVLAMLCAAQNNLVLRIVSRDASNVGALLARAAEFYEVKLPKSPEIVHYNDKSDDLSIGQSDLFLTTSWQSTLSVSKTVPSRQIVYLVQDDERLLLRGHDDLLRCNEALTKTDVRFVVNTALLLQHLKNSGLDSFNSRAISFEPAFPPKHFFPRKQRTMLGSGKRNFLFYADPERSETIYYRGLEVIANIVEQNILREESWNIYFVGDTKTPPTFPRSAHINILGRLTSEHYAQALGEADLGLALMHMPHIGYPTLELAASGAIAVTNRFANKAVLSHLCENIICVEPSVEALTEGILKGVTLATDQRARTTNFAQRRLNTDWTTSFAQVIPWLLKGEA